MLLGVCLAPIHCLSSRSLTSNTSREFIVYYVLQDRRPLGRASCRQTNGDRPLARLFLQAGRYYLDVETKRSAAQGAPVDPAL